MLNGGLALSEETASQTEEASVSSNLTADQFQTAIDGLGSSEFTVRQRSMEMLKKITAEQIPLLAMAIQDNPNNEVARSCVELLERRYATGDRDSLVTRQASEALESAAKSERWFVAEAARAILERHWKRRVEIACKELQKLGVPMEPRDPVKLWEATQYDAGPFGRPDPISDRHLKIHIDEYWTSSPARFAMLTRLSPLVSENFLTAASQVSVYLIDGHPLKQEEISELNAVFGETRVQARSRVCLGISNDRQTNAGNGVMVGGVSPGKSADNAGILESDLLLRLQGEPLKDFDHLIETLKAYRPGDEVTFVVQRFSVRSSFEVKVKLQGWYER